MRTEVPVIFTECEIKGWLPLRAHHIPHLIDCREETVRCRDNSEDLLQKLINREKTAHKLSMLDAFENNDTGELEYNFDVWGKTPEESQDAITRFAQSYVELGQISPKDLLVINARYDNLCDTCVVGDHCGDVGDYLKETRSIYEAIDWLRIYRAISGQDWTSHFSSRFSQWGMGDDHRIKMASLFDYLEGVHSNIHGWEFGGDLNIVTNTEVAEGLYKRGLFIHKEGNLLLSPCYYDKLWKPLVGRNFPNFKTLVTKGSYLFGPKGSPSDFLDLKVLGGLKQEGLVPMLG